MLVLLGRRQDRDDLLPPLVIDNIQLLVLAGNGVYCQAIRLPFDKHSAAGVNLRHDPAAQLAGQDNAVPLPAPPSGMATQALSLIWAAHALSRPVRG